MAAHLNMHHADVILPCTSYFNPGMNPYIPSLRVKSYFDFPGFWLLGWSQTVRC
jgi:hypothetical protein